MESLRELYGLQVPKRIYSLEELRLNKIEAERFLSPADETLNTVRTVLQVGVALMRAQWHGQDLLVRRGSNARM